LCRTTVARHQARRLPDPHGLRRLAKPNLAAAPAPHRRRSGPLGIAIAEDHRELAGIVRAFLDARGARAAARNLLDAEAEQRPDFWSEVAALGWLGLHVSEEYGGTGFGLPELVVVVEEFGRAV